MQQNEMERMFDGIYHRTIPLILFSFLEDQEYFSDLLSALYDAWYRSDETSFNEIYEKLDDKIKNRKSFGSHKENLIKSFGDRFLSLDQRIRNIDKIFLEFQEMVEQIKKDHNNVKYHAKRLRTLSSEIKKIQKTRQSSHQDVNVDDKKQTTCIKKNADILTEKSNTTKESKDIENQGIHIICKNCGHDWFFKGGGTRATCSQCNKTCKVR